MSELPADAPIGLLISRDLLFISKVTGTALALGLACQAVPDGQSALAQIHSGRVACVFLDLADPELNVDELAAGLPVENRPALVAFGSHVDTARLQAARDAGCTEVLPRSRFSGELPGILRRYLDQSA